MGKRKPNSQECVYFGRKLSNICTDDIETSLKPGELCIGTENDDQIYFGECLKPGEKMIKERVKMFIEYSPDDYHISTIEIDLEDVLKWAYTYCSGIYEKIYLEKLEDTDGQHRR